MAGFIISAMVGVICIVIGISNIGGNLNTIHSYHRHRVSEEDRLPFGRLVGWGTIVIGISVILLSVFSALTVYTENDTFIWVGIGIFIAGLLVGTALSFYAMIKYNKGIF